MSNSFKQSVAPQRLAAAIVQTLAYVDVFDYPLTAGELHRYLQGVRVSQEAVVAQLHDERLLCDKVSRSNGYYMLQGRESIVDTRLERAVIARQLWPAAIKFGNWMARLPFVRMVAVTGSLAVNNAEADADIDYLIVTANDRLWLCRAFAIAVVRWAARSGITLCPNYLLSERALVFRDCNLYTAHELTQMVPLSGWTVYRRMRKLNEWTRDWLPNALDEPSTAQSKARGSRRLQTVGERLLGGRIGRRLEQWEMQRKLSKFGARPQFGSEEAQFASDWCKGHFEGHATRILDAFGERVQRLEK